LGQIRHNWGQNRNNLGQIRDNWDASPIVPLQIAKKYDKLISNKKGEKN